MEPIPKPLLRRLVLTFLVGTGCFFTGLVLFLHQKDISFFILSILLFAGSAIKAVLLAAASGRLESTAALSSQVSVLSGASVEAGMNSLSGSRVSNQAPASTATQSADKPQMVKVLFLSVGLFFFII